MASTPTRSTSEQDLNAWNVALRQSPGYQAYIRSLGKTPGDPRLTLSRSEQAGLERTLASAGIPIPSGMHIDQGGNLNQKNRLARNIGIGAAVTAAALATAGAAGFGPLAGVMGGGAGAGGGAGVAATTGGAAGGAGAAGTTAATGGLVAGGGRFANLLGGIKDIAGLASGINTAVHGGVTPMERGITADERAQQAARNRLLESQVAQAGPSVDAAALANVLRSGRLANYTPPSASSQALFDKYGKRLPPVDPNSIKFAGTMQEELLRRIQAGEPLTLSGVSKPGAQELADTAAARRAADNPNGTGFTGLLNSGAQLAKLAPTALGILDRFGVGAPKRPRVAEDNTYGDFPVNG